VASNELVLILFLTLIAAIGKSRFLMRDNFEGMFKSAGPPAKHHNRNPGESVAEHIVDKLSSRLIESKY
jgi:hypothetical protein